MLDHNEKTRFEDLVLPHLNAAYNLAGRLLRNPADAEDATQEALVRAYRFFPNFRGTTARSWLLQIVRNRCYSWLRKNRPWEWNIEFDEEIHRGEELSPEAVASRDEERIRLTPHWNRCQPATGK